MCDMVLNLAAFKMCVNDKYIEVGIAWAWPILKQYHHKLCAKQTCKNLLYTAMFIYVADWKKLQTTVLSNKADNYIHIFPSM